MVALKAASFPRLLKSLDPQCRAALVYGPDAGLVAERAAALADAFTGNRKDGTEMVRLDERDLADDPARLDVELATRGDPAADLGALLSRDLSEPLGDIEHALRHYEATSGEPVDRDVVRYHAVRFGLITPLATAAIVARPPVVADYVQYLSWYLVYARCPLEIVAHLEGVELAPPDLPDEEPEHTSSYTVAHDALRDRFEIFERGDAFQTYRVDALARLAAYLRRCDRFGRALEVSDLEDAGQLLGRRPADGRERDTALEALVAGHRRALGSCRSMSSRNPESGRPVDTIFRTSGPSVSRIGSTEDHSSSCANPAAPSRIRRRSEPKPKRPERIAGSTRDGRETTTWAAVGTVSDPCHPWPARNTLNPSGPTPAWSARATRPARSSVEQRTRAWISRVSTSQACRTANA